MSAQSLQPSLTLADDPLSTDCYSVRLLLALLQLEYRAVYADVEQPSQAFQCPVLLGDPAVVGVMPILHDLVQRTQTESKWIPADVQAQMQQWDEFNQQLKSSLGQLRQANLAVDQFLDHEQQLKQQTQQSLLLLDDHLCEQSIRGQQFLLSEQHPTLADLIVFPQVALAWDAGVSLVPFLHIRRWINRLRHQPHFIPMPGLLAAS
ncbi:glutathione S-transferase [Acinetobacter ihumii]|uniref:glutathione S-transferase n=1 Tax=Acinetobacter ihumii TaxID=2483802 RepID=UPI00102F3DB0|nr:glutathione S-transferase [Acinetobacter ihumii]